MGRRTRHDLYYEILGSLEEGPKLTTVISDEIHANFERTRSHLSDLVDEDLIWEIPEEGRGRARFELTAKGKRAKELFDKLWSMLEGKGEES